MLLAHMMLPIKMVELGKQSVQRQDQHSCLIQARLIELLLMQQPATMLQDLTLTQAK